MIDVQKKVTVIIGEPASGKSTLMRMLLNRDAYIRLTPKWIPHYVCAERSAVVLGDYDGANQMYPGTDRMSMAVQPRALSFIAASTHRKFIFEGDRLGNMSMIEQLVAAGYDVQVIRLLVTGDIRAARGRLQGRTQDAKFLKSRETKMRNMHEALIRMVGVTYVKCPHWNLIDTEYLITQLRRTDSGGRV